ncbi:MAG TPA: helix-turn-helix transcriptional regulator [Coleofasciculaceae cyanobacterium]
MQPKIKEARKHRQMTQKELADKTGLSIAYISNLENPEIDSSGVSLKVLARIAEALGCPFEELLDLPMGSKMKELEDRLKRIGRIANGEE